MTVDIKIQSYQLVIIWILANFVNSTSLSALSTLNLPLSNSCSTFIKCFFAILSPDNNYAYVINQGVQIINIANKNNPYLESTFFMYELAFGYLSISADGNNLYFPGQYGGVVILDTTDKALPYLVGIYPSYGSWVQYSFFYNEVQSANQPAGSYLITINGADLLLLNVTIAGSPVLISTNQIGSWYGCAAINETFIYLVGEDRIGIIDLSNSFLPQVMPSNLQLNLGSPSFAAMNEIIVIADVQNGLTLINVSNISFPFIASSNLYQKSWVYPSLALSSDGKKAFVADTFLTIFDIENIEAPKQIASYVPQNEWDYPTVLLSQNPDTAYIFGPELTILLLPCLYEAPCPNSAPYCSNSACATCINNLECSSSGGFYCENGECVNNKQSFIQILIITGTVIAGVLLIIFIFCLIKRRINHTKRRIEKAPYQHCYLMELDKSKEKTSSNQPQKYDLDHSGQQFIVHLIPGEQMELTRKELDNKLNEAFQSQEQEKKNIGSSNGSAFPLNQQRSLVLDIPSQQKETSNSSKKQPIAIYPQLSSFKIERPVQLQPNQQQTKSKDELTSDKQVPFTSDIPCQNLQVESAIVGANLNNLTIHPDILHQAVRDKSPLLESKSDDIIFDGICVKIENTNVETLEMGIEKTKSNLAIDHRPPASINNPLVSTLEVTIATTEGSVKADNSDLIESPSMKNTEKSQQKTSQQIQEKNKNEQFAKSC